MLKYLVLSWGCYQQLNPKGLVTSTHLSFPEAYWHQSLNIKLTASPIPHFLFSWNLYSSYDKCNCLFLKRSSFTRGPYGHILLERLLPIYLLRKTTLIWSADPRFMVEHHNYARGRISINNFSIFSIWMIDRGTKITRQTYSHHSSLVWELTTVHLTTRLRWSIDQTIERRWFSCIVKQWVVRIARSKPSWCTVHGLYWRLLLFKGLFDFYVVPWKPDCLVCFCSFPFRRSDIDISGMESSSRLSPSAEPNIQGSTIYNTVHELYITGPTPEYAHHSHRPMICVLW